MLQVTKSVRIKDMFSHIDNSHWNELPEHFNENVEYIRPGYEPIIGLASLMDFYRHRRIIKSGCHTVEMLCANETGKGIIAMGEFEGIDKQGNKLNARFCDVYHFENEKIVRRETFFNAPLL